MHRNPKACEPLTPKPQNHPFSLAEKPIRIQGLKAHGANPVPRDLSCEGFHKGLGLIKLLFVGSQKPPKPC